MPDPEVSGRGLRIRRTRGARRRDALAPIDAQEVWGAGVTYERSRVARMEEAVEPSIYDRVTTPSGPRSSSRRPWRAYGPAETIAVRADSGWNAPEPEFALVLTPSLEIAGYTIGNDVSSREIEGENPLYLPQAKTYDGSCAIGPAIVPASEVELPVGIRLQVTRDGIVIVDESTSTGRLHRTFDDLLDHLGRALSFPHGAFLLTGTGIVAGSEFSLTAGDVCRIEMDGLGALENRVSRSVGVARDQPVKPGQHSTGKLPPHDSHDSVETPFRLDAAYAVRPGRT